MSRPSSLSPEQLEEMLKLAAVKTGAELAEIYQLDRSTIHYHFKKAKKASLETKTIQPKIPNHPKKKLEREEKINAGKNYSDYLKIENEKRKKQGLYRFK